MGSHFNGRSLMCFKVLWRSLEKQYFALRRGACHGGSEAIPRSISGELLSSPAGAMLLPSTSASIAIILSASAFEAIASSSVAMAAKKYMRLLLLLWDLCSDNIEWLIRAGTMAILRKLDSPNYGR